MTRRLRSRERIILAGGAITIGLVIGGRSLVPRWLEANHGARDRWLDASLERLDTRARFANLPLVVDSLEARTGRLIERLDGVILEPTPDEAVARLGGHVSALAAIHAVRLEASELTYDSIARHDTRFLFAATRGAADVAGLAGWLAAIESGVPEVRAIRTSIRQPNASADASEPEELSFEITFRAIHLQHEVEEGG